MVATSALINGLSTIVLKFVGPIQGFPVLLFMQILFVVFLQQLLQTTALLCPPAPPIPRSRTFGDQVHRAKRGIFSMHAQTWDAFASPSSGWYTTFLFYSRLCPSPAGSSPPQEYPNFLCPLLSLSIPFSLTPQCHISTSVPLF